MINTVKTWLFHVGFNKLIGKRNPIAVINAYDYKVEHPKVFKTWMVKDMLFAHYICPQKDKQVKLWSHYNTIAYTLRGKKRITMVVNLSRQQRAAAFCTANGIYRRNV